MTMNGSTANPARKTDTSKETQKHKSILFQSIILRAPLSLFGWDTNAMIFSKRIFEEGLLSNYAP